MNTNTQFRFRKGNNASLSDSRVDNPRKCKFCMRVHVFRKKLCPAIDSLLNLLLDIALMLWQVCSKRFPGAQRTPSVSVNQCFDIVHCQDGVVLGTPTCRALSIIDDQSPSSALTQKVKLSTSPVIMTSQIVLMPLQLKYLYTNVFASSKDLVTLVTLINTELAKVKNGLI